MRFSPSSFVLGIPRTRSSASYVLLETPVRFYSNRAALAEAVAEAGEPAVRTPSG
jgi:hypothetical protein